MPFDLNFRTPISFGWGLSKRLGEMIPKKETFLVLGRNRQRNLHLKEKLEKALDIDVATFSGVEPNPSSGTIMRGADLIASGDPEQIVAMGGGSVMDAAKVMALIAHQGGTPLDYGSGKRIPKEGGYPLYAVPTTPGTSSEITPFAVVSMEEMMNKVGIRHPSLYPDGAVIDPELTITLPPSQTAATGMDILTHAVESYWARKADPVTRELSLRAVSLVNDHLEGAFVDGSGRDHREGISLASVFAGLAFSNTGTTICHSISYPITYDSGLEHGIAVALTLGPTFDVLKEKGFNGLDNLANALGTDTEGFRSRMEDILRSVDAPVSIGSSRFRGDADRIMDTDMTPLLKNMPVKMDEADLERIVRDAF